MAEFALAVIAVCVLACAFVLRSISGHLSMLVAEAQLLHNQLILIRTEFTPPLEVLAEEARRHP